MTCEESAQFDSLKASCEELLELAEEYFGESSADARLGISPRHGPTRPVSFATRNRRKTRPRKRPKP